MPFTLQEALSVTRVGTHDFTLQIEDGWEQGKATFGGLVLGALVRAMQTHLPNDGAQHPMRSVQGEILGVAGVGTARIRTRLLRESKTVSTLSAELYTDESVQVHAIAAFGQSRPFTEQWRHLPSPVSTPDWQSVGVLDMDTPFAPNFTRHFEYRPTGPLPFSSIGSTQAPEAKGFIRPQRRQALVRDGAYFAALSDAWWLSAMTVMEPRPAATLTIGIDVHDQLLDHPEEAPLFHHGRTVALSDGYATELRDLYRPDGRLVAISRQLIAIIK